MNPAMHAGGAAAAAHAAKMAKQRREEEEEMSTYQSTDLPEYEFKIIRSATGGFKNLAKFRAILEKEAEAGWELVEKFDNSRARVRRRLEWREKDADLSFDPYRINVGVSEGALVAYILLAVFGAIGLAAAIAILVAK